MHNPGFGAVFFRRTTVQIRNEGGLWDESAKLYPLLGAQPKEVTLEWKFPSGASISMAHLEHEKSVSNWQGAQIALELFDELTHFSEAQFFYMLSRNRSMSGVRPYVRATCNPDADSWVRRFIGWWIDPDTGYAIPERAGVIRWFVRIGDKIIWGDKPEDLAEHTMEDDAGQRIPIPAKSVTFIPAKLTDNKALLSADPGYMASLLALPTVERERLLGGNWKIRPAAGLYFRREWVTVVDAVPADLRIVRGWDLAATPKTDGNDPDWTVGHKMGRCSDGRFFMLDHRRDRQGPSGVERMIKNTASADGQRVQISLPQDPGQAGVAQKTAMSKLLAGYDVRFSLETGDKLTRFSPFSAQAEAGNVFVLRGDWNEALFHELEGFPEGSHDDDADAVSRSFNALLSGSSYTLRNI